MAALGERVLQQPTLALDGKGQWIFPAQDGHGQAVSCSSHPAAAGAIPSLLLPAPADVEHQLPTAQACCIEQQDAIAQLLSLGPVASGPLYSMGGLETTAGLSLFELSSLQ